MKSDAQPRICVIGAGPSGLAAAKNMLAAGLARLVVYEKGDAVGGNWVFDFRPGHSSIYETAHTISSRRLSQFDDYPMPADFPEYPSHRQLRAYFAGYAEHFGVLPHVRFGTEVVTASPSGDGSWRIDYRDRSGAGSEEFDRVLVANGHHWDARMPVLPGDYSGRLLHAHDYKSAEPFRGQRVLVIGGGNSACDIAVETARVAADTNISMRRGYFFFPKFVNGRPIDIMFHHTAGLPRPLRQRLLRAWLWVMQGSNRRYGMAKPDHQPLEHHPIVNSELLYAIKHRHVKPKPAIAAIDGRRVTFVDGTHNEFETIIAATGYRTSFPFLDENLIDLREATEVPLHLNIFHPRIATLYFVGLVQPVGCIWTLADLQARLVARHITDDWRRPPDILSRIARQRRRRPFSWASSPRHALEVEYRTYRRQLLRELAAA